MTTEMPARPHHARQPELLTLTDADPFFEQMQDLYQAVARRAYGLFEERGRADGHDLQDWLIAESELLNRLPLEIREQNDELVVRADMPGFREKDIEVRVNPHRLMIRASTERVDDERKKRTAYINRNSRGVLRVIDLSKEIDPHKATTSFENGTLEVVLPKARRAKRTQVAAEAA